MIFAEWQRKVDGLMRRNFALTIADAGFDEVELNRHYHSNVDPAEFVHWFADKYSLTSTTGWTAFR